MDKFKCIKMVQESKHRWRMETHKGIIITENLYINSIYKAEEYIKNYISSYSGWSYELVPILKAGVKNA